MTVGATKDDVLYAFLGRAGVQARARLGTMLDPAVSPILRCQEGLLRLAENFRPTIRWSLCTSAGCDYANEDVRMFSRQQLLGSSVGLFQFLELSWSQDLHRVSLSGLPDISVEDKHQVIGDFFEVQHTECSSFASRRIRALFPSFGQLYPSAGLLFQPFLNETPVINDFNERLNAKIRSESVRSSGKASNFTVTSNRCFVPSPTRRTCANGWDRSIEPSRRAGERDCETHPELHEPNRTTQGGRR